jgi:hypothetical protein
MQQLFDQQRALDATGARRNVLIIMDDAPVDKDTRNAIIEVGFRGRHYGVSLWILAISFVMAPKPLRRSLDCLIILSGLPLQSDRKALTEDFCGGAPQHALWALENLKTHQALVCILTKGRFNMYVYRARNLSGPLLTNNDEPLAGSCEEGSSDEEECKKIVQGDLAGSEADLQTEVQPRQDSGPEEAAAHEETQGGVQD